MNKLVITKEQHRSFADYEREYCVLDGLTRDELMEKFINTDFDNQWKSLNDFTPEQFALLLCGWYEVEERFKVGDWAVWKDADYPIARNVVFKLQTENQRDKGKAFFPDHWPKPYSGGCAILQSELRHATAEEIEQEKKRRFWANLNRKVDQYQVGDIFSFEHDDYHRVTVLKSDDECVVNEMGEHFGVEEIKLVCPAEKRLDK